MTTELWTEEELVAAVIGYRIMQIFEDEGKAYRKSAIYSKLESRYPRTAKAFRRRMHNISSVLEDSGQEWLTALKPLSHVGAHTGAQIATMLGTFDKPTVRLLLTLYDSAHD